MMEERNKGYDFKGKDRKAILTPDEFANFNEGMKLKNMSPPADKVNIADAVSSVCQDLDRLFA